MWSTYAIQVSLLAKMALSLSLSLSYAVANGVFRAFLSFVTVFSWFFFPGDLCTYRTSFLVVRLLATHSIIFSINPYGSNSIFFFHFIYKRTIGPSCPILHVLTNEEDARKMRFFLGVKHTNTSAVVAVLVLFSHMHI